MGPLSGIQQTTAALNGHADDPAKKLAGAQQFEALLIAEMLKSMREAGSGAFSGTGDDAAGVTTMELAEQHFAEMLSAQGGLGLAKLVVSGLDDSQALIDRGVRTGS